MAVALYLNRDRKGPGGLLTVVAMQCLVEIGRSREKKSGLKRFSRKIAKEDAIKAPEQGLQPLQDYAGCGETTPPPQPTISSGSAVRDNRSTRLLNSAQSLMNER